DRGGEAGKGRREWGGAGRIVAGQRERHHADAAWIEFRPRGEILVDRRCILFGLRDQRQIAEPDALAIAWAVDNQTPDAARGEVGNAIAVLEFLGDVETVEKHHAGRWARSRGIRLGVD